MKGRHDRFPWWSIIAGAGVFAVVFAGAVVFAVLAPPRYRSTPELLVAPSPALDRALEAEYYDVIDQGTLVQNFAEILRGGDIRKAALDAADVEKKVRRDVDVDIVVPTETSILQLQVTSPDKETSIAVGAALQEEAVDTITALGTPLVVKPVTSASQQVAHTGLSPTVALILGFVAALVLGIATQQAVAQLAWTSKVPGR